jgi:hypothetical protein
VLLIANGLRRARRWAWVTALVLLALNVVFAAVLMALIPFRVALDLDDVLTDGTFALDIGTGFLSLVLMIYLVIVRGAFARRRHPSSAVTPPSRRARMPGGSFTASAAEPLVDDRGTATTTSHRHGDRRLRRRADAAIALGDPLGPEHGRASRDPVHRRGGARGSRPVLLQRGRVDPGGRATDGRSLVVADDTIVDLPGLAFTGKRFNSVRTTLNRAQREDVTFRLTRLVDEPWGIRAAERDQRSGSATRTPRDAIHLGTLAEAADPEVRIALAIDARAASTASSWRCRWPGRRCTAGPSI